MDENNQQNMNPMVGAEKNKNSAGALIGILIIILLIALGGYYILAAKLQNSTSKAPVNTTENTDPYLNSVQKQSSSDEAADIQNDLNNTKIDDVDAGVNLE